MAVKKIALKLNDTGAKVIKAKEMLNELGSKIVIHDKFTIGMYTAVCSFQRKNELPVTGVIDQKTWDLLIAKTNVVKRTATKTKKGAGKK